jgi:hypothetical protein
MNKLFLSALLVIVSISSRAQWEPDVRLTNNPSSSFTSINNQWCIGAKGDTLHGVWTDLRDGNTEIYYKRSVDRGLTWGADTRLTNNPANSNHPCISVSGSIIHIAWCDYRDGNYEIYYKRSTDRGTSWGADTRLTNSNGSSFNPSIAVTGFVVNIVWYDFRNGNWEIYYTRSTDGGLNWVPDTRLTNDPANSYNACIAVSGSIVNVVWGDYRDGVNGEIYYKQSSDGCVNWGQDIRLTNDPDSSRRPCVATYDSVVHVVWHDNRDGNSEIYYKRSIDGGITWGTDTRLTNDPADSWDPSIAVFGSTVHVVWFDNRDGNFEIYYKKSEDEGLNWGTDARLTNADGDSEYPSIAFSDSVVHVIWTDLRDGNEEIYYKRDPTGGFPEGIGNDSKASFGQEISIWPNPASNIIHIKYNNCSNQPIGQTSDRATLTIRNILGKELLIKQIQYGESVIKVSNLQNSFYFVSVKNNNQVISTKLMIAK